jgi:hypothetical protein
MWEPQHLTTLWASTACYRDSFTFTHFLLYQGYIAVRRTTLTVLIFKDQKLKAANKIWYKIRRPANCTLRTTDSNEGLCYSAPTLPLPPPPPPSLPPLLPPPHTYSYYDHDFSFPAEHTTFCMRLYKPYNTIPRCFKNYHYTNREN